MRISRRANRTMLPARRTAIMPTRWRACGTRSSSSPGAATPRRRPWSRNWPTWKPSRKSSSRVGVEIVLFGEIDTGKSALINALVGQAVAEVDVRGGWTKEVWSTTWSGCGYCVPGFMQSQVVLLDTPGINEVDGAQRATMAREAAGRADLILFVTDSDLNQTEFSALAQLAAGHKPIILVFNKIDNYTAAQRAQLNEALSDSRLRGLIAPGRRGRDRGRSPAPRVYDRRARRIGAERISAAPAAGRSLESPYPGSARARRQGPAGAQCRDVCRRQERSHRSAQGADARRAGHDDHLELRGHEERSAWRSRRCRSPTCWAAAPST